MQELLDELPEVVPPETKEISPSLPPMPVERHRLDEDKKQEILDLFMTGESLLSISKIPGMPSYQKILRALNTQDTFRNDMKACRETRALHFEEKALESALTAREDFRKDSASIYGLEVSTYKWLAEVSDPSTYGKRTTVSGDKKNPIQIVVRTGVPDPGEYQRDVVLDSSGMVIPDTIPEIIVDAVLPDEVVDQE